MSERMVAVEDLTPGDCLDLEGDDYADPWPHENAFLACEMVTVEGFIEVAHGVAVVTDEDTYCWPTGWKVKVGQHIDFETGEVT